MGKTIPIPLRSFSRWPRMKSMKMKSKKLVDIQYVPQEKFPEAVGFMRRTFADDPFMRSMGISERHTETQKFISALWLALLRSGTGLSLAAVHRNRICGLSVNCPQTEDGNSSSDILLRLAALVKTDTTRHLLQAWDKIYREAPLPSGKTRIMELAGLAVSHQNRRQGIAQKLVESSANLAMLLGFDYVRVDCTNPATAKICDRLGWHKIWEMPFEKFEGVMLEKFMINAEKESLKVKVYLQPVRPRNKK